LKSTQLIDKRFSGNFRCKIGQQFVLKTSLRRNADLKFATYALFRIRGCVHPKGGTVGFNNVRDLLCRFWFMIRC
uniref:Ovule protein n=1 Tax=Haemonchus placei TaxID=6290 RepID=A0A0N4WBF3_HAEPC